MIRRSMKIFLSSGDLAYFMRRSPEEPMEYKAVRLGLKMVACKSAIILPTNYG